MSRHNALESMGLGSYSERKLTIFSLRIIVQLLRLAPNKYQPHNNIYNNSTLGGTLTWFVFCIRFRTQNWRDVTLSSIFRFASFKAKVLKMDKLIERSEPIFYSGYIFLGIVGPMGASIIHSTFDSLILSASIWRGGLSSY